MPNAAYDIVCDALSRIVSRRAAENIVSDALRVAKLTVLDVRPEQLQALLKNAIFTRLQQIIPVAQAKGEIRQILMVLEAQFTAARAFSPEVEEGWLALREEFARVVDQRSPRAQRLAKSIADLPSTNDPVRVLNDLWAELDLLQLELSPNSDVAFSDARYQGDLLMESGEFAALDFELEHTEVGPDSGLVPALGRPGAVAGVVPVTRINQDLNLTIIDEQPPQIPETALRFSEVDQASIAPLDLDLQTFAPPTVPKPSSSVVMIFLETPEAQEALLTRFALEEGVTGVLLSKRNGDVLVARLSSGSANHLAGVVAATTMLLGKQHQFKVFYTHLESVSAFIAPLGDKLLTVLADAKVNVGRVFTELESLKESA